MRRIIYMVGVFMLLVGCLGDRGIVRSDLTSFDQHGIVAYRPTCDSLVLTRAYVTQALTVCADVPIDGIYAKRYLVWYLDEAYPLIARAHMWPWPMASVTKLMSAVVAAEQIDSIRAIGITDDMLAAEGETGQFVEGEEFVRDDLIRAMLVASSNDAAEILAQAYDRAEFLECMRAKAKELALHDTTYADPTGLSDQNRSTPVDLFRLIAFVHAAHPQLLSITTHASTTIHDAYGERGRTLPSTNLFTREPPLPGDDRSIEFVGGKTGYTHAAIGNLVSLFSVDGRMLAIIVMGSRDRFGDTRRLLAHALRDRV